MTETAWTAIVRLFFYRLINFLPNLILKKVYPVTKLQGRLIILATGFGPQLYVTTGHRLAIETIQLVVVNLLPFPVDFEDMQLEILLEGTNLASKDANIAQTIEPRSIRGLTLSHELNDNQAGIAKNYVTNCPILRMGGRANFRACIGLFSLPVQLEARAIIYK